MCLIFQITVYVDFLSAYPYLYNVEKGQKVYIKVRNVFRLFIGVFYNINIISLNYGLHNKQNTTESYLGGVLSFLLNNLGI